MGIQFYVIPAVSTVAMLLVARSVVPEPEKLETGSTETEVKGADQGVCLNNSGFTGYLRWLVLQVLLTSK